MVSASSAIMSKKKVKKKSGGTKKVAKRVIESKKITAGAYSLVIVESPAKAKTIKKYLGRGFMVVASNGHIKDLPKSKLGVDVKKNFAMDLVPITGKKDKIEKIQELARDAEFIFLAPDPDREGEAIAFHLAEELNTKKKIKRVLFNAITKKAVVAAIESPTELDSKKYDSQRTRRILDRLVGYKISPILWEKVQRGLSAGRVQSVALRIITDREQSVRDFKPEQWFSVHAKFSKSGSIFEAKYYGDSSDKKIDIEEASVKDSILKAVSGKTFKVTEVKKREKKQNPTPPFTTSKLQQDASNRLGFTTRKTMSVAQKLYEGIQLTDAGMQGLITYMRTDSVRTEPEALLALREYIAKEHGKEYVADEIITYTKKGSKIQDAHEAIRPASLDFPPDAVKGDLNDDEFKLYTLIWNKFISSQMSQAIIDQTSVTLEASGKFFKASGSIIKFPGFRTVYLDASEKAEKAEKGDKGDKPEKGEGQDILPDILEGETLKPVEDIEGVEHWTSPPPRYNEASLVKELEEQGIGRPSTYASIISNIQDRGYVEKQDRRFYPTELGEIVCKMLVESFPDVMDITFTAKIEELLDQIEEGGTKWKVVLSDFWAGFEKTLDTAKEEMKNLKKQEIPTGVKCLKCGNGEYMVKWGRNGQFLACSNYPDCSSTQDFKRSISGEYVILPKEYVKDPCPECSGKMVVKKGRFGRFIACEDYPNCKTTLPYTLDVFCPECKIGKFAEKKSRYGKVFYGCSNYPACTNAMWTLPRKFDCPSCGYSVMGQRETKRDGKHLQCPKCRHKVSLDETPFVVEEVQ